MLHNEASPLAGQTVRIASWVKHPQNSSFGGADIRIEDWWDRVSGGSWMFAKRNPACLVFAMRTGFSERSIPTDDDVLYGKTADGLGHLIHVTELAVKGE